MAFDKLKKEPSVQPIRLEVITPDCEEEECYAYEELNHQLTATQIASAAEVLHPDWLQITIQKGDRSAR